MKKRFVKNFCSYFLFGSPSWFIHLTCRIENPLNQGSIVDIETDGLSPKDNHILTLGLLKENIHIYQLIKPQYNDFKRLCVNLVNRAPLPHYAYFAHFEQSFLGIQEGWHCLGRYREDFNPNNYEPYHSHRYSLVDITHNPCNSPEDYDIDGHQVPTRWGEWLHFKNPKILAEIPYHCLIDLLRERQLLYGKGKGVI